MRDKASLALAPDRDEDRALAAEMVSAGVPAPNAAPTRRAISFGPFRLFPAQQLLLEGETPVRLGSRALEILIALVERPGELVSKGELMARVWPDTVVVEANLKVHVAALRRALGDGRDDNRYMATTPGRGYRFVAPVLIAEEKPIPPAPQREREKREQNLLARITRPVGRVDAIARLAAQRARQQLLTIVGPGGSGKSTIAD